MRKILLLTTTLLLALSAAATTDYTHGLSIWFDTPTSLKGRAVWYGGRPDLWRGKGKPETAGGVNYNFDAEWESKSLPIGNGSIGANIMGSVEAERITFNEKTLWRGGPNTSGGAEYYWNVNKKSAHLLAWTFPHLMRLQRHLFFRLLRFPLYIPPMVQDLHRYLMM